ncbi:aspartate kinase [Clostridium acetobutylicum]|uniref:Aspartokinase n=1 Tax=Clostridium acetobutylicum (strain ATCC 824 / DSM 792 / JCM 1419 / IAM 19013 / LMG 5710 / NBRC 13948 / NRRL B-527 / VKM B-1787 / 2291 / W) TaxID=272562 RepID=Q97MC0_CLOAB|nr:MULTISPECIES: aspartate kinase [Clostridium]AAK78259.1 Aspartate kinase [Clostridium acetobutylicum ATCC 824]ADZ19326.1 aspartate kinase [Clostridium acetobutylicum EA 2018]AEI31145.1 aspartate kinase [Clostridium acetobutylicum DSM 1731]AWV82109.1 aspartate kinase [Clostridium acetobutylicum]AWV82158.1 aspartate kinase [Clostridium acetobutylicum]
MKIVVTKFGGSSLADSNQFKKVKGIIDSDANRKYIIPSAPGKRTNKDYKITDLLYLCNAHVKNGIPFDDVFKLISQRYTEIVSELNIDMDIAYYLEKVKKNIENGASSDYAASRGEYLNGVILAKYLNAEFIDAAEVIFFDKSGCFDEKKSYEKIKEKVLSCNKAVIPGFYGSSFNGDVKTFSRGGSDVTGSIISAGVNADLYENWTDVSGFLMADPRIVENPKTISKISYKELRELSYMGATVLHEEAIFPVKDSGIPINIKNTNKPSDPGTLILSDTHKEINLGTITGIAGKKNFTVIAIEKALLNSEVGFCRKILSILEMYGVSFEHMPSGVDSVSLVIEDCKLDGKCDKIIEEIKKQCNPDSIEIHPNMALVATVGTGMAKTKGIANKIFTALSKENVNIRMIDQGSSEINVIVGVETVDFEKAVKSIYNAFN